MPTQGMYGVFTTLDHGNSSTPLIAEMLMRMVRISKWIFAARHKEDQAMTFPGSRALHLALAGLALAGSATAATDVEAFAALPLLKRPQLSPDGRRYAALVSTNGRQFLVTVPCDASIAKALHIELGDERVLLSWDWVNDDWLIIRIAARENLQGQTWTITRALGVSARDCNGQVFRNFDTANRREGKSLTVPALFLKDTGKALAFCYRNGCASLYELDLATMSLGRDVFSVQGHDIEGLHLNPDGTALLGVSFPDTQYRTQWWSR